MVEKEQRELIVERRRETLRITIPATWRITFGALQPGARHSPDEGCTLRIYEGEDKQRLVFTDVVSFRDASIPMQKRYIKRSGKSEFEEDAGGSNSKRSEEVEEEWRNY